MSRRDEIELFRLEREPTDLDDLLEDVLADLLRDDKIAEIEVLLRNRGGRLIKVAEASAESGDRGLRPRIIVESWLLVSPVRETRRRAFRPKFTSDVFLPLLESGELLGCLRLGLRPSSGLTREERDSYSRLTLQLAGKIRIVLLRDKLASMEDEYGRLRSDNLDLTHRITSMSKDLYAVTAISTKINQSMDLNKSISKSAAKLEELFHAASVRVYLRDPDSETWREHPSRPEGGPFCEGAEGRIGQLVEGVLASKKPVILGPTDRGGVRPPPGASPYLVGVPLQSGDRCVGALVLAGTGERDHTQDNLRLLSGVANIMGMAVENMNLYRRGQRNQRNAAFLARVITEFSRTLNLKDTLHSVVRRGAEFGGPQCQVFLFSETKVPLLHGTHLGGHGENSTPVSALARLRPAAIQHIVRAVRLQAGYGSILFETVEGDGESADVRTYLREMGIGCLVALPLQARSSMVGLLLVGRAKHLAPFDTHDLSLLEALGNAASVAIDNARTHSLTVDMSDSKDFELTRKDDRIQFMHDRYQYRIEARDDILFWVDTNLTFVFGNLAMATLFEYPREELCAQRLSVADGIADEDRERVFQCLRQIISKEKEVVRDVAYRHVARSGAGHVVSVSLYPLMNLSGQIIGVEGVGRDVTEEKRLEAELVRAKDLAVLGEFSSAIAHQIRNPLGNILMGTKLLQKALGLGEKGDAERDVATIRGQGVDEVFSDLCEGVNHLNSVVTELLAYTQTMKLRRSSQDIEALVADSLAPFSQELKERNVQVTKRFDPELPPVEIDFILLANAIQNIVHNAIQAMPDGGHLCLTATPLDGRRDQIVLSVSDTGPGIPRSELDKIFRPFYTTKDTGVGLGLALAHRIVEAHGGTIWACVNPCTHLTHPTVPQTHGAEAALPCGATVHVRLPLRSVVVGSPSRDPKRMRT